MRIERDPVMNHFSAEVISTKKIVIVREERIILLAVRKLSIQKNSHSNSKKIFLMEVQRL